MTDVKFLKQFLAAVERGKEEHPGPYPLEKWREALADEIEEFVEAIASWDREPSPETFGRIGAEAMDIAVVAFRMTKVLFGARNSKNTSNASVAELLETSTPTYLGKPINLDD